jgi:hypothetical protein
MTANRKAIGVCEYPQLAVQRPISKTDIQREKQGLRGLREVVGLRDGAVTTISPDIHHELLAVIN